MTNLAHCILFLFWKLIAVGVKCDTVTEFNAEVDSCSWTADSRLCGQYAMDFHQMRSCALGQKAVVCHKSIIANNKENSDPDTLHIVSYNVRQIPPLYYRECERERTCRIPEALFSRLPTVDVITFQELFFKGCIENNADMARLLKGYNFTWSYQPLETPQIPGAVGAGLMIASRWPIVKTSGKVFKEKKILSSDFLSTKGVIYAAIEKMNRLYHIFTTHTQSGYGEEVTKIRQSQALEIFTLKSQMNISRDEPVVYTGDYNEDWYAAGDSVKKIFATLRAKIATKIGPLNYTFDNNNPLVPKTDKNEWLDYIASSTINLPPKRETMEAINLRSRKTFEYCQASPLLLQYVAPWSAMCFKTAKTDYLSDHYLLYGVLEY